ncbi:hypothetical protein B0H15DRAFT_949232 [Mycena belliarum]|uniref:Uncharacterized protein n=1 Tax=Mycena belliarum TaxID=1033014 RepID=A0AAD6XPB9_9AGAR|nr:hypothetical protein B0H15DRAFT_949232 [Mycena belliae]
MKFLFLVALFAAPLASYAVPIPQKRMVSPFVTQFSHRSIPHRLRSNAAGLVSRIPAPIDVEGVDSDDVFLARALEDTIFASAEDFVQR